jgi:hypothetical protein
MDFLQITGAGFPVYTIEARNGEEFSEWTQTLSQIVLISVPQFFFPEVACAFEDMLSLACS